MVMKPNCLKVGTGPEECRVAERRVPRVAADQVPGRREARVHQREDGDVQHPVCMHDEGKRHEKCDEHRAPRDAELGHDDPRSVVPNRPCGLSSRTTMSTPKNVKSLHTGDPKSATKLDATP